MSSNLIRVPVCSLGMVALLMLSVTESGEKRFLNFNLTNGAKPAPELQSLEAEQTQKDKASTPRKKSASRKRSMSGTSLLNITFATDPGQGEYDGVVGKASDVWNLIDYGQRSAKKIRLADGSESDVEILVSENDGEWGIQDQLGVYHAYIYHNCRCVDLEVTVKHLPAGIYNVYVYAHGDAPEQNAAIEIQSGGVLSKGKSTLNDGTWNFRDSTFEEGNQYIRYLIEVTDDAPVCIISRRDGSNYAMLNAIQFERLKLTD